MDVLLYLVCSGASLSALVPCPCCVYACAGTQRGRNLPGQCSGLVHRVGESCCWPTCCCPWPIKARTICQAIFVLCAFFYCACMCVCACVCVRACVRVCTCMFLSQKQRWRSHHSAHQVCPLPPLSAPPPCSCKPTFWWQTTSWMGPSREGGSPAGTRCPR